MFVARVLPRALRRHVTSSLISRTTRVVIPSQAKSRFLSTTPRRLDRSFTNILADDNPPAVQVSSIGNEGIQLVDGLKIPGPCIFLEGRVFLWDVPSVGEGKEAWKEWKEDHFELFDTVIPAPEILLFGTGKRIMQPPLFLRGYLNQRGIQLDVLDTRNACSTYNLLSEEGRRVAAVLLPLTSRSWQKPELS
ncbi:NADH dehydrogenase 1 alpha subcomplex assembly factor 3 [Coprinopsis sp. MPI-PUGE-AT-0042]|nr:NADH dehydrogenase 1 alpha subcomplex assembly factor 3 [Coprinopsis sp. MPI-PUGE-AT-0042]